MWFFKKKRELSPNHHILTDEDREQSAEIRRIKKETQRQIELMKLEEAKVNLEIKKAELEEMLGYDDEEEPDDLIHQLLQPIMPALLSKFGVSFPANSTDFSTHTPMENAGEVTLTNEKINEIWNKLPSQYQKYAKKMKDEDLIKYMELQIPNLSQKSKEDILLFIKNR